MHSILKTIMTTAKKTTATNRKKTTTAKPKTIARKSQPIPDLPANPFIFEIFDLCGKQRSAAKKVEVLQKYSHPCLKLFLSGTLMKV